MSRIIFFRDFRGLSGGHLKVWHYFSHLKNASRFDPQIFFSKTSLLNQTNPWVADGVPPMAKYSVSNEDIVFLAGLDWADADVQSAYRCSKYPVVNLIQGLRHADPNDPRFQFLKESAIRVCVSKQVADAIIETGNVNGPVFTIKNGLDTDELKMVEGVQEKVLEFVVVGYKNPDLADKICQYLAEKSRKFRLIETLLPRREYLHEISRARVGIFLPMREEGFYLPPLEAMYLKTLVICPDCVGNRGHCIDKVTCLRPIYDFMEIKSAIDEMIAMSTEKVASMLKFGRLMTEDHAIAVERRNVIDLFEMVVNGNITVSN